MEIRNDPSLATDRQVPERAVRQRRASQGAGSAVEAAQLPQAEPERVSPEMRAREAYSSMQERVRMATLKLDNRIAAALESTGGEAVISAGRAAKQNLDQLASSALQGFEDTLHTAIHDFHQAGVAAAADVGRTLEQPLGILSDLRRAVAARESTGSLPSDLLERVEQAKAQIDSALQQALDGARPAVGADQASFSFEALRLSRESA